MRELLRSLAVTALMLAAWSFTQLRHDQPTPLAAPLAGFPQEAGGWRLVRDARFDPGTLAALRPTDYLSKRYVRADGATAELYVGYHDGASQAGPLHSPRNCLPGAGWYEVSSSGVRIPLEAGGLDAVQAVYRQGTASELFLYWFQVGGEAVASEYALKAREVLNSVLRGRRDTAFIRISVPVTDSREQAAARAEDFLRAFHPALKRFLPS